MLHSFMKHTNWPKAQTHLAVRGQQPCFVTCFSEPLLVVTSLPLLFRCPASMLTTAADLSLGQWDYRVFKP